MNPFLMTATPIVEAAPVDQVPPVVENVEEPEPDSVAVVDPEPAVAAASETSAPVKVKPALRSSRNPFA